MSYFSRSLVEAGLFNITEATSFIMIGASKPDSSNQWKWTSTDDSGVFVDERYQKKCALI